MDNNHISSLFDKDLNKLNNNLLSLGNTALDQFDKCINNFGTQDIDKIEKVINGSKEISESYFTEHISNIKNDVLFIRSEINNENIVLISNNGYTIYTNNNTISSNKVEDGFRDALRKVNTKNDKIIPPSHLINLLLNQTLNPLHLLNLEQYSFLLSSQYQ